LSKAFRITSPNSFLKGRSIANDIWFLGSIFPEPPYDPTTSPPSGEMLRMYPAGRSLAGGVDRW
jgi:hypothetical protein